MNLEMITLNKKFIKEIEKDLDEGLTDEKVNHIIKKCVNFCREEEDILKNRSVNHFFFQLMVTSANHLSEQLLVKKSSQEVDEEINENMQKMRQNTLKMLDKARVKFININDTRQEEEKTTLIDDTIKSNTISQIIAKVTKIIAITEEKDIANWARLQLNLSDIYYSLIDRQSIARENVHLLRQEKEILKSFPH